MNAEGRMQNAELDGPSLRLELRLPLPPHKDPVLWRRLMRSFAMVWRASQQLYPGEAVRALQQAVFCNRKVQRLEKGQL